MPELEGHPPLPDAAREELEAVYRDVDCEIEACGVTCWLRGSCCNFAETDHKLYASSVEISYLVEKRREAHEPDSVLCPFWENGRCFERERRPLGCRTYFCDPKYRDSVEAIYETYHARIRAIADKHSLEYRYLPFVATLRPPRTDLR